MKLQAINALGCGPVAMDANGNIRAINNQPLPTEEQIQAKIAELQAAEPLRLLRIERNQILQQSDWRDLPSYPGTDQEAWRTYRQALRDITETQTPELDEFGNLTNITWPEEPA